MTRHQRLQRKIRRGTGQQARRAKPRRTPVCEVDGGQINGGQCASCGRAGTGYFPPRERAYLSHLMPRAALESIWSSTGLRTTR